MDPRMGHGHGSRIASIVQKTAELLRLPTSECDNSIKLPEHDQAMTTFETGFIH
jgi:hypothetical protein